MMTEKELFNRFLDAQEHPERYSDDELESLLHEGKELAELKRALYFSDAKTALDADKAWREFSRKHPSRRRQAWLRVAASIVGVLIVGSLTVAAVVGLHLINNNKEVGKPQIETTEGSVAGAKAANTEPIDTLKQTSKPLPEVKVFDNVRLEDIIAEIAKYYRVEATFENSAAKDIRLYFEWHPSHPLDEAIELLNSFQKINISRQGDKLIIR